MTLFGYVCLVFDVIVAIGVNYVIITAILDDLGNPLP